VTLDKGEPVDEDKIRELANNIQRDAGLIIDNYETRR
jgi:hypothetical protein